MKPMTILLWFLIVFVVGFLCWEIASFAVYGWFAKASELDVFIPKHLSEYRLNELDAKNELFYGKDLPYIAANQSVFSKWHIKDHGQVPRWSKWSKEIDAYREKLIAEGQGAKKLSEL